MLNETASVWFTRLCHKSTQIYAYGRSIYLFSLSCSFFATIIIVILCSHYYNVLSGKEDRATFEKATQTTRQQMKQAADEGVRIGEKTVKVKW